MLLLLFVNQLVSYKIGVVDMGSTGTRLNIYEYQDSQIVNSYNYENTPGISNLNEREIILKMADLLKRAGDDIKDIRFVPIGVYGTAGLRSISQQDSQQKLELIKSILRDYNIVECKVLSGREEGVMAYNSLLYIVNNRKVANLVAKLFGVLANFYKRLRNYALIDMGGKSVQVAYDKNNKIVSQSYVLGHSEGITHLNCTKSQSLCIKSVANKLSGLPRDTELNSKEIYLSSYFYDVLRKNVDKPTVSLKELKEIFNGRCNRLHSDECKDLFYIVGFLTELGISPYKKMHLIGYFNGSRFNWTIGKSYELLLKSFE